MGLLKSLASLGRVAIDPYVDECFYDLYRQAPYTTYDVGAAHDLYHLFPNRTAGMSKMYGFEPVQQSYADVVGKYHHDPDVQIFNMALSKVDGTITFNLVDEIPTLSSTIVVVNPHAAGKSKKIEVASARLDSVAEALGIQPPDFIKLDTEGGEINIFESGQKTLETEVLGIFTEFAFYNEVDEQPEFRDIDAALKKHDFILFDIQFLRTQKNNFGAGKGRPRSGDALYFRNFMPYYEKHLKEREPSFAKSKLIKLITTCLAYRYFDYALELALAGKTLGLISQIEYATMTEKFLSISDLARHIPNFPGKRKLANAFDLMAYLLNPRPTKGVPAMINAIGNRRANLINITPPDRPTLKFSVSNSEDADLTL